MWEQPTAAIPSSNNSKSHQSWHVHTDQSARLSASAPVLFSHLSRLRVALSVYTVLFCCFCFGFLFYGLCAFSFFPFAFGPINAPFCHFLPASVSSTWVVSKCIYLWFSLPLFYSVCWLFTAHCDLCLWKPLCHGLVVVMFWASLMSPPQGGGFSLFWLAAPVISLASCINASAHNHSSPDYQLSLISECYRKLWRTCAAAWC